MMRHLEVILGLALAPGSMGFSLRHLALVGAGSTFRFHVPCLQLRRRPALPTHTPICMNYFGGTNTGTSSVRCAKHYRGFRRSYEGSHCGSYQRRHSSWTKASGLDINPDNKEVLEAIDPGVPKKLAVTLLSGFLGAGKTTLLCNLLEEARGNTSLAVLVNDMTEVNVDAQLLESEGLGGGRNGGVGGGRQSNAPDIVLSIADRMMATQNSCIYYTLREDLKTKVKSIADESEYDYLIIESTGISDPLPVAQVLSGVGHGKEEEGSRDDFGDLANYDGQTFSFSLDTLVTVVDSANFLEEVRRADDLGERGLIVEEGDTRTIADLLIAQVEFANVILLNKGDLISLADMDTLEALVRRLNPNARVMRTTRASLAMDEVVGTGLFDLECTAEAADWVQELNEDIVEDSEKSHHHHDHDRDQNHSHGGSSVGSLVGGESLGVGSFTYRARRPFHSERLMEFVMDNLPTVLRSKGFLWLATRHNTAGVWNQAGGSFAMDYGGVWEEESGGQGDAEGGGGIQTVRESPGQDATEGTQNGGKGKRDGDWGKRLIREDDENFDDAFHYGERCNELVFIGIGMDETSLRARLDLALLTSEEMEGGPQKWDRMTDPFPPWLMEEDGDSLEWEDDKGL